MMESDLPLIFSEPLALRPMALFVCFGLMVAIGYVLLRPWPPQRRRAVLFGVAAVFIGLAAAGLLHQRVVSVDSATGTMAIQHVVLGVSLSSEQRSLRDVDEIRVTPSKSNRRVGPRATVPMATHGFDLSLVFAGAGQTVFLATIDTVLRAENAARGLSIRLDIPARRYGYAVRGAVGIDNSRAFELGDGRSGAQFDLEPVVQLLDSPEQGSTIREATSDQPRATENRS